MTTPAQKPIKTGIKPTLDFHIPVLTIHRRQPIIRIKANNFIDLETDKLNEDTMRGILDTIKSQVLVEKLQKREVVYLYEDIIAVLEMPELERDSKSKEPTLKKNGQGKAKSRAMKDRRRGNRIKALIEDAWDILDETLEGDDGLIVEEMPITITLKADDAVFLCEQMLQYYEVDYIGASFHVVDAHDIFTDLKAKAEPLWSEYVSGKDEESEKEEPKKK